MWFALALLGAVPKLSSLASPDFVNAEGRPVHLLGEASEHCLIKKYVPAFTTGVLRPAAEEQAAETIPANACSAMLFFVIFR